MKMKETHIGSMASILTIDYSTFSWLLVCSSNWLFIKTSVICAIKIEFQISLKYMKNVKSHKKFAISWHSL